MTPKKFNKEDNRKHFDFEVESLLEDESGGMQQDQPSSDSSSTLTDPKEVSPEQLRIDSLRLALKVIKLFDAVTAQDLLSVSSKISDFLINHKVGDDYDPNMLGSGNDADESEEESENYPKDSEEPTEEEENFEIPGGEDDEDLNIDDLDDEEEEGEAKNEASSEVPNEFFI